MEQRGNDELLEWAGLSLLNHIKGRTGAVKLSLRTLPISEPCLVNVISCHSDAVLQFFFFYGKTVAQPWPRGGNVGERAFLHGLNGVGRRAG